MKAQNTRKGFSTLLFTLVILLTVTVTSFISANTVVTRQQTIVSSLQHSSAFQAAQAGLDYAIPYLESNYDTVSDGDTVTVNLSNGNRFELQFAFNGGSKDLVKVTSTGYSSSEAGIRKVEQEVKLVDGTKEIAATFAAQSRGSLKMENNASISDLTGSDYTTKLGSSAQLLDNANTTLDSGTSSTSATLGPDLLSNDTDIASKTDSELETYFLGATFADYQNETTDLSFSAQSATYEYNTDLDGLQDTSILLTQTGGTAKITSNTTIGSSTNPAVVVVNLSNGSNVELNDNTVVYGKMVVNNGSMVVKKNTRIHGDLVVQGDLQLEGNVIVDGDIIVTGNITMSNNAILNGAAFALGKIEIQNNVIVNGAVLSGDKVTMLNNAKVIYDREKAAITIPGGSALANYGKVSGSWSDL